MATPQKLREIAITLENEQRFHIAYKAAATSDGRSTSGSRRSAIRKFVDGKIIPYLDTANVERLRRYFDDTMGMPKFVGENQYAYVTTVEFWKDEVRNPELKVASEPSLCPRLIPLVGKLLKFSPSLRVYLKDMKNTSDLKQFHEHLYGSAKKLGYAVNHSDYAPLITALRHELNHIEFAATAVTPADLAGFPTPTPQEPTMAKPIDITTKTLINGRDIKELSDSEVFQLIADEEARIAELEKIKAQPKKLVAEIEKRKAGIATLVAHLDAAV